MHKLKKAAILTEGGIKGSEKELPDNLISHSFATGSKVLKATSAEKHDIRRLDAAGECESAQRIFVFPSKKKFPSLLSPGK